MTESALFQDLALVMSVAGAMGIIFSKLNWPKVIGYLFAGVLLSKNVWGVELFADQQSISTIGQLGIVFLMFALGLEFSPSDMRRIKGVVMPAALFDMAMMTAIGYTIGRKVFGWDMVPSVFLGAAMSDSATTLLSKTIEELGWGKRKFVRYIFGTTIGEDILCVGLIAIIVGVANGKGMSLGALGLSMGGLLVFFTAVIVFGLIFVPRLLNNVGRMKDSEALLLTILGCCFFVSWAAFKLDYSLALGAFLVGILGACSWVHKRLLELVAPLRSMFSAMFFVSIGILVDPAACAANWKAILLLVAVVLFGKAFNISLASIMTGQDVKNAVQTGMGLAQIGEFAYMVALLYMTETGDTASPMYQIVVGVSLLTTIMNPLVLKASDPVGEWIDKRMPARLKGAVAAYHDWLERYRKANVPGPLRRHIRTRLAWLFLIAILHVAVFVAASLLIAADWRNLSQFFDAHKRAIFSFGANIFFISALYPIYFLGRSLGRDVGFVLTGGRMAQRERKDRRWIGAVQTIASWFFTTVFIAISILHMVMANVHLLPDDPVMRLVLLVTMVTLGSFGWSRFRKASRAAGFRFTEALQAEKKRAAQAAAGSKGFTTLTVPGDFHQGIDIFPSSPAVGKTIKELDIRAVTGASIVAVVRDGAKRRNPGPGWRFEAGDTAMAIGEPHQLAALKDLLAGAGR